MNRTIIALLIAAACITPALAVPPTAITNYYAGTVVTSNTFADAGDTGLTVSNTYICVPLAVITNAEYTAALVTNDVRPYISAMVRALQTAISAQPSTNRFTTFTVSEEARYTSATNRIVFRGISEQQTITVTPGYPTQ